MNLKEAKKLQPGALVRMSWGFMSAQGLVLNKVYVKERHTAKSLSQEKEERYDVHVQWLDVDRMAPWDRTKTHGGLGHYQSWELMVVSHAPK